MKRGMIWFISVFLFPGLCIAQAPHEIAGFALGKNINEYKDRILTESDLPVRYLETLREVEIKEVEGFKSGLIIYGTCNEPGKILKIKLKYADSSRAFYDALLKRFKQRFGEPSEWRGDPFHIVINWKWSFTDKENNRISLHLQHNTRDLEEKLGNSVKLTMTSGIEAERHCFEAKHQSTEKPSMKGLSLKMMKEGDWERFIPQ
ncbi:MAG: hypothetical protein JRH18_18650 [Deltaproteobacteria bacterium]|nr:hypothetical protein [Deltaproteobacteria bacterium]MBW1960754.1 hypothetical protein [Deltaproteobacteria bacterium]MBW1993161.1 hypothetical protein [Deltaproteobacteria bacterium]MBW2153676.1 hypothetical protein [Deltaproteobacteria bacterium]